MGTCVGGDRRSRATLFCGMDRVGWDHVPPLPPHLHGNQGARLLVSLPAWGTGHRVRWGYTSPSAWGAKGLGPLVPLPAWGTHLHGALGGWGHPCPCLHRGLGGVWVMRVLTCRVRWSHAYPCVRGSRATGQSGLGLCTSLPAWAQDTVGTGRHPLCPTRTYVPAVHCGVHWSIWPQGCPQVGKLETLPVPVCMVSTACAQVWDFLDDIQDWGDAACSETPGLAGWWAKVAVSQSVPPALRRARNKL